MFNNLPENNLASGVAASYIAALIAKYSTAPTYKGKVASNYQQILSVRTAYRTN